MCKHNAPRRNTQYNMLCNAVAVGGGTHVYTKYRGHTHNCHELKKSTRLFVAVYEMLRVRSIMAIRTTVNKAMMVVVGGIVYEVSRPYTIVNKAMFGNSD